MALNESRDLTTEKRRLLKRMTIATIYRNAGTTGLQVKFFFPRVRGKRHIPPFAKRATSSLLVDISNLCARIAVLHAVATKEARFSQ